MAAWKCHNCVMVVEEGKCKEACDEVVLKRCLIREDLVICRGIRSLASTLLNTAFGIASR